MSIWSREALERERVQQGYNAHVAERTRAMGIEQSRVRAAASERQMIAVLEKGLRHAVDSQPDLFPEFDYIVAAEIVAAYILGGR